DTTSIDVGGQIFNRSPYSFALLDQAIPLLGNGLVPPGVRATWATILGLAMDPSKIADLHVPPNQTPAQLSALLSTAVLFLNNPGFFYNPTTGRLGFNGQMSDTVRAALEHPLTLVRYGRDGLPMVDSSGHFMTQTVSWGVAASAIEALYVASQGA